MLVTGSTGLLGATMVEKASHRFAVVAGHRTPGLALPGTGSFVLDLRNPEQVEEVVASSRPAVVVHCAAETGVDFCEDHPEAAMEVNVCGTARLCRAAVGVRAFLVYVSTDSVFDGRRGGYSEEDQPNPVNAYGRSKWSAEQVVRREMPDHLIIRTNFFGWNHGPKETLAEWVLGRLQSGNRVPGFQDVVFSPLLVDMLVEKMLAAIELGLRGRLHLGARDAVTKCEFARLIARTVGLDPALVDPVSVDVAGLRAPRPRDTSLDSSRAEKALNVPMPTVQEGIRRFWELETCGEVVRRRTRLAPSTLQGACHPSG